MLQSPDFSDSEATAVTDGVASNHAPQKGADLASKYMLPLQPIDEPVTRLAIAVSTQYRAEASENADPDLVLDPLAWAAAF